MAAQVALKRQQAAEDRMCPNGLSLFSSMDERNFEQPLEHEYRQSVGHSMDLGQRRLDEEEENTILGNNSELKSVLNSSDDIGIQSNSSPKSRGSEIIGSDKRQISILVELFPEQPASIINVVFRTFGGGFEDTIEHFLRQKKTTGNQHRQTQEKIQKQEQQILETRQILPERQNSDFQNKIRALNSGTQNSSTLNSGTLSSSTLNSCTLNSNALNSNMLVSQSAPQINLQTNTSQPISIPTSIPSTMLIPQSLENLKIPTSVNHIINQNSTQTSTTLQDLYLQQLLLQTLVNGQKLNIPSQN